MAGLEEIYLTEIILIKWQLSVSVKDLFCPGLSSHALPAPFPLSSQFFEADVVISILQFKKLGLREVLAKHPIVKNYEGSEILPLLHGCWQRKT